MTNFIFKSASDLQKIRQQLEVTLKEQRHQRSDLAIILKKLEFLCNEKTLQKQVDDYYETHPDSELDDK